MSFHNKEDFYKYANEELAKDDADAELRFDKYKSMDPFMDIKPALLNSNDIFKYVAATGMIYPFHIQDLSGAGYSVRLKGTAIYWNKDTEERIEKIIDPNDEIILIPNSIAFITLEPVFRIPEYIALRFNLKISHVYKGLLLGTGPIVDPGFVGKLSIPLHNLTANYYSFKVKDEMIKMEFTKLSPNNYWSNLDKPLDIKSYYLPSNFKGREERDLIDYIKLALKDSYSKEENKTVCSSIPQTLRIAKEAADSATVSAEGAENVTRQFQGISIGVIAGIIAVVIATFQLVNDINSRYDGFQKEIKDTISIITNYEKHVKELEQQIKELEQQINEIKAKPAQ